MDRAAEDDSFVRDLTKVGPWKIQTSCFGDMDHTALFVYVNGPAGSYQFWQGTTNDDSAAPNFTSSGNGFTANFPTLVLDAVVMSGGFPRIFGTAQIHANSGESAMLEVNGLADRRNPSAPRCILTGVGIPAG
jgi:hypothetical protein